MDAEKRAQHCESGKDMKIMVTWQQVPSLFFIIHTRVIQSHSIFQMEKTYSFFTVIYKKNGISVLNVHLPLSRVCLSCVELQTDLIACTQTLTQTLCHRETHQSTSQPLNKKDDI